MPFVGFVYVDCLVTHCDTDVDGLTQAVGMPLQIEPCVIPQDPDKGGAVRSDVAMVDVTGQRIISKQIARFTGLSRPCNRVSYSTLTHPRIHSIQ